jgi:BRCA1-associated RING domain protein 1
MENHLKVPKRENNLMQKSADIDCNGKCSANSDDQLSEKISKALEQTSSNITICGFCQSARVSEVKPLKVFAISSALETELLCL